MGKSKKRILSKNNTFSSNVLKRTEIVGKIISDIKTMSVKEDTVKLISLFGIKAEELLEAGLSIEEISVIEQYLC